MSISAINWALDQPLKCGEKFVLVVLAHHANNDGQCWPGIELLVNECGITRSSVINHINTLVEKKLISKEARHNDRGYRRSSLYTLHVNQSPKFQRRKNQRRDFDSLSPNFDVSKVRNSDGNIIELSLEQTIEHPDIREVASATQPVASENIDTTNDVQGIFAYWRKKLNHPKAKFDSSRKKKIKQALKLGYSVEDLKLAIDGCSQTPFNLGQNANNASYDDLTLILRDASHIERFMQTAKRLSQHDGFPMGAFSVPKPSAELLAGVI